MSIRRKIFGWVGILFVALVALTLWTSRSPFSGSTPAPDYSIFDPEVALTFASSDQAAVLVRRADELGLDGVLLQGDAIDLFNDLGYLELARIARESPTRRFAWSDLGVPARLNDVHVAAGTNYRAHAEEVLLDGDPFVFPKLSAATSWNARVPMATRLDYEAELCAVTLRDFTGQDPELGYLLCNDFTDRWDLVKHIDFDSTMGTTGFPEGKGGAGRLPVGPLLVVPRDRDQVAGRVRLALGVNGRLRQAVDSGLMIWPPAEFAGHALEACALDFRLYGQPYAWPACDRIPARTLLLTGTGAGVMFKPLNLWLATLYLQPDDEVTLQAPGFGRLVNRVGEAPIE